jgi:hypothetical protein
MGSLLLGAGAGFIATCHDAAIRPAGINVKEFILM